MADLWALSVMSFKGTVPGAVHAYGVLSGPHDRNYKIAELLDAKAAKELNDHAERVGKDWLRYEANEPGEFFMREEDLEECARVAFTFLAAPGSVLARGLAVDLNPSKVLHAEPELMKRLNAMYEEDESLGDFDPRREDLGAEWVELMKELGLEEKGNSYHPTANFVAIVDRGNADWEKESSPCGYRASVTLEPR